MSRRAPLEAYPRLVTLSLNLGECSLWLLRYAGYPELASEGETAGVLAWLSFRLGKVSMVLNHAGIWGVRSLWTPLGRARRG